MLAFHFALSLHALLALQPPPAPAAPTAEQTIIWFRSPDAAAIDARALLDAVSVYTRDLGLAVRTASETKPVPTDASAASQAAAALRAQGARLGFWCELRPGADVAVLTVVATDGHLELHLVERTGAHEAEQYRAIALKLRSVLVGTAAPEPAVVVAPAPPPPAPRAPPPPAPAPAAGPDLSIRAQAPAPAVEARRMFVSVGYRLSTPFESAAPRHALAVDGTLPIGRLFEVDVGTELAARRTQSHETDATGSPLVDTISVFDWPITAGVRVVRRGPRVTVGAGPYAALHLLWASADGGESMQQMHQSAFTASGGAGAELIARARLTGALSGELRLYGEVPLPTTGYTLRGAEGDVLNVGARAGIGVGLAFPTP